MERFPSLSIHSDLAALITRSTAYQDHVNIARYVGILLSFARRDLSEQAAMPLRV